MVDLSGYCGNDAIVAVALRLAELPASALIAVTAQSKTIQRSILQNPLHIEPVGSSSEHPGTVDTQNQKAIRLKKPKCC